MRDQPQREDPRPTVEGMLESIRVWRRPAIGADLIPPSPFPPRGEAWTYLVEWTDTSGAKRQSLAALDARNAQRQPPGIGRQLMVVALDPLIVVALVVLMADGEGGVCAEVAAHGLPRAFQIPIETAA